jgi:DNA invertase Pin-like site-specific DNA recombinase
MVTNAVGTSSLAEFERELIIARTGEGRTRAKARGVKFGRPELEFRDAEEASRSLNIALLRLSLGVTCRSRNSLHP